MIRLLCVEDDPLLGTFLATRLGLEPDMQVTAVVPSAGAALEHLKSESVDVLLLDYWLDGADGMQLMGALGQSSSARVLFCTGAADDHFARDARLVGAHGVLFKDRIAQDLVPAVRSVAAGRTWF